MPMWLMCVDLSFLLLHFASLTVSSIVIVVAAVVVAAALVVGLVLWLTLHSSSTPSARYGGARGDWGMAGTDIFFLIIIIMIWFLFIVIAELYENPGLYHSVRD